jgi:hypothetical protein
MSIRYMLTSPSPGGQWRLYQRSCRNCPLLCHCSEKPVKGGVSSLRDSSEAVGIISVHISTFGVLFYRPGFKFKN